MERFAGTGAYGPVFDDPETIEGFVSAIRRMTRDGDGAEVVSTATVALPPGASLIPAGSRVTLPPEHGGRMSTVISIAVGDGGGNPTPDHMQIELE